jgi:predicted transcriptional regulator
MSDPLVCVDATTLVGRIRELSWERAIHHFPVFGFGEVVGFVCTCDLEGTPPRLPVRDVMRTPVITVQRSATTAEAARLMLLHEVGSAVVLDRDIPCGIVTRTDLAQLGEDIADIIHECHCANCGGLEHLKIDQKGRKLCQECRDRARAGAGFEVARRAAGGPE